MLISDEQLKKLVLKVNLIDQKKLDQIEQYAKNSDITLSDALIERDIITDENLGILIADYLKIPFVVLNKISIPEEVFRIIPERVARKYKAIPYERNKNGVKVAIPDVSNPLIVEMIY